MLSLYYRPGRAKYSFKFSHCLLLADISSNIVEIATIYINDFTLHTGKPGKVLGGTIIIIIISIHFLTIQIYKCKH